MRLEDILPERLRGLPVAIRNEPAAAVRAVGRLTAQYRCPKRCPLAEVRATDAGNMLLFTADRTELDPAADRELSAGELLSHMRVRIAGREQVVDLAAATAWIDALGATDDTVVAVCGHGRHELRIREAERDTAIPTLVRRVLPPMSRAQR